ncbi:MAG TPA: hypothetical protein VFC31_16130 [Candidatus Limnocylindria bacterium]|nr:hypothetical protein [Candidatus Limnocylindria bacterium]
MSDAVRIAVFGRDDLRQSVLALGFEPSDRGISIAVIDTSDPDAVARAASLPPAMPRAIVGSEAHRALLAAIGAERSRIADSVEPAVLGPVLVSLLPATRRTRTQIVSVSGVRGGVGRTLLVTNVARRLARSARVCVVDATGSGAAAWWLGCDAASWSTLEGLVDEMSADHLSVVAHDAAPGLRLVGGAAVAPSIGILSATIRAAAAAHDVVLVDAPVAWDPATGTLRTVADRCLFVSYDDAASVAALAAAAPAEDDWIIASQSRAQRLGEHPVFRAMPRDESAVAAAIARRDAVGGALGRAYDDLAELVAIDAS